MKYMVKGKELTNLRRRKNLSQDQLARLVGFVGPSSIGRIEKGTRPVDREKLEKLAKVFEVAPDSLVEIEVDDNIVYRPDPATIRAALRKAPEPVEFHVDRQAMEDLKKRVELLERKPEQLPGLTKEEIEILKLFRSASEMQKKLITAAARGILKEDI